MIHGYRPTSVTACCPIYTFRICFQNFASRDFVRCLTHLPNRLLNRMGHILCHLCFFLLRPHFWGLLVLLIHYEFGEECYPFSSYCTFIGLFESKWKEIIALILVSSNVFISIPTIPQYSVLVLVQLFSSWDSNSDIHSPLTQSIYGQGMLIMILKTKRENKKLT